MGGGHVNETFGNFVPIFCKYFEIISKFFRIFFEFFSKSDSKSAIVDIMKKIDHFLRLLIQKSIGFEKTQNLLTEMFRNFHFQNFQSPLKSPLVLKEHKLCFEKF